MSDFPEDSVFSVSTCCWLNSALTESLKLWRVFTRIRLFVDYKMSQTLRESGEAASSGRLLLVGGAPLLMEGVGVQFPRDDSLGTLVDLML